MLKFGGSRPESDGNDPKDRERKQRHQRTAAAVAVAATGASAAVPGNGATAMDTNRGPGIAGGAVDATSKPHQMAPPESPFGTGQPPVVIHLDFFCYLLVMLLSLLFGKPNQAELFG